MESKSNDLTCSPNEQRFSPRRIKRNLVEYMKDKVFQEEWHGVADAAMDLRELEARYPELTEIEI